MELLAVIAIIGLLVAILLPAINMARETARRNQCLARQRDLAIALQTHDKEYNGLPGYLNQLGETPIHSWAVALFPHIGESKRYEVLMSGSLNPDALVSPPVLLCPSDNPREPARLNYVVNCGPVVEVGTMNGDDAAALTLFKDRRVALTALNLNKKVKLDEIPNGTSNTILLSENVDAGVWDRDVTIEKLGFVWSIGVDALNYAPNSIDRGPRPSSKHPGTVVVAYADGSAKSMNDDIDIGYKWEEVEKGGGVSIVLIFLGEYLKAVCADSELLCNVLREL